jgi:putative ABC transport system ATP-binding protein
MRASGAGSDMTGAEVVVDHVSKTYDGRIRALVDVSFRIEPGELVAVTGPSGSGKSTLLQLVGSLDRPDSGTVVVDGIDVAALRDPSSYRRDVVGFVFQLHHLLPHLTAQTNVEVPLIGAGIGRAERHDMARDLLAEVGLEHRADHRPSELSGGERQRVAIARALASQPRLLLADEPTGALDSGTTTRILDLLANLRARRGMTLLIVSYEPRALERADRTLHLRDGHLQQAA